MQAHGDPVDPACQIRDSVSEQLFKAAATVHGTQWVLPVDACENFDTIFYINELYIWTLKFTV